MGTKTKTPRRKTVTEKVPHKERFGNVTEPRNSYRKQQGSKTHRPASFHNRDMGTR